MDTISVISNLDRPVKPDGIDDLIKQGIFYIALH